MRTRLVSGWVYDHVSIQAVHNVHANGHHMAVKWPESNGVCCKVVCNGMSWGDASRGIIKHRTVNGAPVDRVHMQAMGELVVWEVYHFDTDMVALCYAYGRRWYTTVKGPGIIHDWRRVSVFVAQ